MNQITYQLKNISIAALEFGSADKPLVIALHGWLDNAASFIPIAPFLNDYHLIAIDFAGHGHSGHRSAGAQYNLLDNVQDLHELFLLNGWSDVIILGHSMGGIIGSLYSATFPENVRKLISVEAFGALTKDPESSPQQFRDSIENRIAAELKVTKHPKNMEAAVTARLLAGKMNRESAELLMERNIQQTEQGLIWRTAPKLRTLSSLRLTDEQAIAFIKGVVCPWLTLLGTQGFEKLKTNFSKRNQYVQHLQFEECEGGHHVHMDYPKQVAERIIAFLAEK